MGRYIIRRTVTGALAILFLITATFILVRLMPGSPFDTGNVSEQVLETVKSEYGLDQPMHVQYITYMKNFFHGEFGMSMKKQGVSVGSVIASCLPITTGLGILAFVMALMGGMLLGITQVMTGNRWVRSAVSLYQSIGMGIPNYVFGLLLLLVFGVSFRWLPVSGADGISNYILPAITLAIYPSCVISHMVCTAVEKELTKSYVRFLRAEGFSEKMILIRHIGKRVFSRILVYLGQLLGYLLTGSFVVENLYTIPGLGREFVNSISNRDYTLILGLTVFMGTVLIVIQIMLDVLQMALEPKMRVEVENV